MSRFLSLAVIDTGSDTPDPQKADSGLGLIPRVATNCTICTLTPALVPGEEGDEGGKGARAARVGKRTRLAAAMINGPKGMDLGGH